MKIKTDELKEFGLSDNQINIILERTNGLRSWLEYDLELKTDLLKKLLACSDEQINLLKEKYPYNDNGRFSMSIPLTTFK